MKEFLVLVLALAFAGFAAAIVGAADRSPTPVVVADAYPGDDDSIGVGRSEFYG
jgi:hypothetical protein